MPKYEIEEIDGLYYYVIMDDEQILRGPYTAKTQAEDHAAVEAKYYYY